MIKNIIAAISGGSSTGGGTATDYSTESHLIEQADLTGPPERVDALSYLLQPDGSLFGGYSFWINGEGGDTGNAHIRLVTAAPPFDTYTKAAYNLISMDNIGDIHASFYRQSSTGKIIMIFASQSNFDDQVVGLKMRTTTDNGTTWSAPVTLSAGAEERWITKSGAIFQYSSSLLLFPVAYRPTIALPTERIIRIWKSTDDGNTWSVVEVTPGVPLEITNPGGTALSEPSFTMDINGHLWVDCRSSDGFIKTCKLTKSGDYFDKGAMQDKLPSPASSSFVIYHAPISKWVAFHNDINDGVSGFDARKRLVYSFSDTNLPGSFVQQPTEIGTHTAGWGHFEPFPLSLDDGIALAHTNYQAAPVVFKQLSRFLTNDMLLNGWS